MTATLDSKKDLRFALWVVELLRDKELQEVISDRCESLEVAFYEHGQANDFTMKLENSDNHFSDAEIIKKGDEVVFYLYFADRPRQEMGTFTVDELSNDAPPSVLTVNGLSSDTVTKDLRTKKTKGYEGTSLFGIVKDVAKRQGLEPVIEGNDVQLTRKEQKEEHDLRFLTRLAEQYGFVFQIKAKKLNFLKRELQESKNAYALKGLMGKRTFRYKNFKTYKKGVVRHYDPQAKTYREVERQDAGIDNDETLKCTERVESNQEADTVVKARLKDANKDELQCDINCMGVPELIAGINVTVEGEGKVFDGKYHVEEAHHTYDKNQGYKVQLKGYKVEDDDGSSSVDGTQPPAPAPGPSPSPEPEPSPEPTPSGGPGADLVITNVTGTSGGGNLGQSVNIRYEVKNQGTEATTGTFIVQGWASGSAYPGGEKLFENTFDALDAGATASSPSNPHVISNPPYSIHDTGYFVIVANPDKEVPESNYTNSSYSRSFMRGR